MPEHDGTQDRRLVIVKISQELFLQVVTTGWESRGKLRCVAGIPPNAVLVNTLITSEMADAGYVFYHPSFDPVPEGQHIPALGIVVEVVEDVWTEDKSKTPRPPLPPPLVDMGS